MGNSSSTPTKGVRSKLDDQLDALLDKRELLVAKVAKATAKRDTKIAQANEKFVQQVGKAPEKLEKVNDKLSRFLQRNHYQLTRRHTKTIQRAQGEIKVVLRATELEVPGDETPIVNYLLGVRGGKQYLKQVWKLDRRALLQAPRGLFGELSRRFGIWRGRHRTVLVKSPSDTKAQTISNRRYNERPLKKK